MKITAYDQRLPGVRVLEFETFTDDRGFFYESYSRRKFAELGIDLDFVQDNHSRSVRDVIRGLHYQGPAGAQWRLVRCTVGEIYDVVVDIEEGSPTFGRWLGVHLSAENKHQLLIPPAYAHGFAVLSEVAEVQYKCTGHHNPDAERALSHADPDLAITWPVRDPVTSAKDAAAPSFRHYREHPDFPAGWDR
jgi:dTDP-4-dehydrorhamnose 3,5-epimerase